jgi:hypothetical protein
MSGSTIPHLQHSDSSLSLRTRKSNHDFRVLAAESQARKKSSPLVDERVSGTTEFNRDFSEREGLLNSTDEVIEIGIYNEDWQSKSTSKSRRRCPVWIKVT